MKLRFVKVLQLSSSWILLLQFGYCSEVMAHSACDLGISLDSSA